MDEKKFKEIEHPMESILDIEPGSTIMPFVEREIAELVETETYDDKDVEIETQFQEVYDAAMHAFDTQQNDAELIEPKYKARTQEIAVQFLNAALSAAKEKSNLKAHKDKLTIDRAKTGPKNLQQNLIVADRNDLLKQFLTMDADDSEG